MKYMAEDTGLLNTQKVKFVMDRGFYSAENLRYLVEKNCRFIIALPGSLKYCRDLIDKHRDEIVNRSECYLGPEKPYGKAYDVNELGFRSLTVSMRSFLIASGKTSRLNQLKRL